MKDSRFDHAGFLLATHPRRYARGSEIRAPWSHEHNFLLSRKGAVGKQPIPLSKNEAGTTASISLVSATEEELIAELARRRAEKYNMAGAMKRLPDGNTAEQSIEDQTGQMCSLNGGDGMIPCRELME